MTEKSDQAPKTNPRIRPSTDAPSQTPQPEIPSHNTKRGRTSTNIDFGQEIKELESSVSVSRLHIEDEGILPDYVALIQQGLLDIPQSAEALQQGLDRNTVETYTGRLQNNDFYLYVARNPQGELVGASYGVIRSKQGVSEKYKTVGHFGLTVVRSDSRGNRIGGKLKEAFEQDCAKREIPKMTTFIDDGNLASIAMNKRMGMQEITDDPILVPLDGGRYYAKDTPPLKHQ